METTRTLTEFLIAHLDHGRSLNLSVHTLEAWEYHVRAFLDWLETACGVRTADRLRGAHLEGWLKHLTAHRTSRGLPLKPKSINKQIEKYGKSNGYRLILIAAPSGTIAYGRKDLDITNAVLKHLNDEYRGAKK